MKNDSVDLGVIGTVSHHPFFRRSCVNALVMAAVDAVNHVLRLHHYATCLFKGMRSFIRGLAIPLPLISSEKVCFDRFLLPIIEN